MASGTVDQRPDESTTGKHLPALDGIRGVAILLVLVFHLFDANTYPTANFLVVRLAELRAACWVGVDLFFVLSGFLITGILFDTRLSKHYFRNFYARRALRIFPLYYGTLAVVAVGALLFGCHLLPGFWYVVTYLASIKGAAYASCYWLNLNHFWTLSVEEIFYLIWPALVLLARTPRRILLVAAAGSLCSIGVRVYLVLSGAVVTDPYSVYSFAPSRFDSLLIGAILAILLRCGWHDRVLRTSPLIFAGGMVWLVLLLFRYPTLQWNSSGAMEMGLYDLLAITSAALIGTALRPGWARRIFSTPVLRFFGRYSYGMYVFHAILEGIFDIRLRRELFAWSGSLVVSVVGTGLCLAVMTTVLAFASFQLYEKRWLLLKRHFEDHSRTTKLRQVVG